MVTGYFSGELKKIKAKNNSFQIDMMFNAAAMATPGAASGMITRRRTWKSLAPSTRAASSRSIGMLAMKPLKNRRVKLIP